MSFLVLDPTCSALMSQLQELDHQRDHLRAQLADAALHVELAEVGRNLPWGLEPERRAEVKTEREAAIQARIATRAKRREKEMANFGSYTRPGTWDADLDAYQEDAYEEILEDGYGIQLVRAQEMTWNGYVILPTGHVAAGKDYKTAHWPLAPVHIPYSSIMDGRGVFGFFADAVTPRDIQHGYTRHNYYSREATGLSGFADSGSSYADYATTRGRCLELVNYFKELANGA